MVETVYLLIHSEPSFEEDYEIIRGIFRSRKKAQSFVTPDDQLRHRVDGSISLRQKSGTHWSECCKIEEYVLE